MSKQNNADLSRRERQIMDVIYQRSRATAQEVMHGLKEAPSYSAVRALLAILVNKGLLKIQKDGLRYLYLPVHPRSKAGRSAISHVVKTFFEGSVGNAVAALLENEDTHLSREEIQRLQKLITEAAKGGRP